MPFSLAVFLECVLCGNLFASKELSVHVLNRQIGSFKVIVGNESMTFGQTCRRVSRNLTYTLAWLALHEKKNKRANLGLICQSSKGAESIVQCLLVHVRIQISHE